MTQAVTQVAIVHGANSTDPTGAMPRAPQLGQGILNKKLDGTTRKPSRVQSQTHRHSAWFTRARHPPEARTPQAVRSVRKATREAKPPPSAATQNANSPPGSSPAAPLSTEASRVLDDRATTETPE